MEIKLERKWELGKRIGHGGFGSVYEARAEDGFHGVVKIIPKAPGADRELLFENLSGVPNVVPIVESGEVDDGFALAMPRAERSLREELISHVPISIPDALPILIDIAEALVGLSGQVVHRDLKPENVLFLEEHWCLADFGIARYAEASTAQETHKYAGTAAYLAPERWRGDRATNASDVYSFGVMAYELLCGSPPFRPDAGEMREQHLSKAPPSLNGVPTSLGSLVEECLYKAPGARPTAANLLRRLRAIDSPISAAASKLQQANALATHAKSEAEAAVRAQQLRREQKESLLTAARQSFQVLKRELEAAISTNAPAAGSRFPFRLSGASLELDGVSEASDGFGRAGYEGFEVVGFSSIVLRTGVERYEGRAHSLWYCDAQQEGVFRWYETAFMKSPITRERFRLNPTGLPPNKDSFTALSPVMGTVQVAWPFTPVDQGDECEFVERWVSWFAQAALGEMQHPQRMPERECGGSFRQPRSIS